MSKEMEATVWCGVGLSVFILCLYLSWLPTLLMLALWWSENLLRRRWRV